MNMCASMLSIALSSGMWLKIKANPRVCLFYGPPLSVVQAPIDQVFHLFGEEVILTQGGGKLVAATGPFAQID